MSAVDFSFARYTSAQLKKAGVTAAGRYLTGSGKAISAIELAGMLFGGVEVWLIFENSASDASDGAAVGAKYAQQANAALEALGLPTTTPVYFSADQDYPNPAAAVPYYQGIASVRPGPTNGCYGEGALIDLLFADGLVGFGFESESTSFPGNSKASPNTAIWQKVNGAPLPSTDNDVILKADFGQLPRPGSTPPPPPPPNVIPEDDVKTQQSAVQIKGGNGWVPSPVPAGQVLAVNVETTNPEVVDAYANTPLYRGFATQSGPTSPNGALVFSGFVDGVFGIEIVYAD